MTRDHLVQHGAQAPQIRALVNVNALRLFRRHIGCCAHYCPGASIDHGPRRRFRIGGRTFYFSKFCQTKIEDLDIAVAPDHYVLWLDVAMYDTGSVGGSEGAGDLTGYFQHLEQAHAFVHAMPQRLAVDELGRYKA